MSLILNTVFVITISLANGGLITFEINDKLCAQRTQLISKTNDPFDVIEISFANNKGSSYVFDLLTDSLSVRSIDLSLIHI